jgi:FkbM family methyltransferase
MPGSFFYRMYQNSLAVYQRGLVSGSPYCRWYENFIRWSAIALSPVAGLSFPERRTGGWWWIWRWRFEALVGWYDPECESHCRRLIRPGSTVLDIGGHIGIYSRLFSRLVGPSGRVIVFEANPENVEVLRRNLRRRKYRNVEIVWAAVSDSDGSAALHVSPGHSNHSLLPGYTDTNTVVEVPAMTIDCFLKKRRIARIDFVKCDTEGAEPLVIRGMEQTLRNAAELGMLFEYCPRGIRCAGIAPEAFVREVESLGFTVDAILPDGTLGQIPELPEYGWVNLLCVKPSARADSGVKPADRNPSVVKPLH